MPWVIVWPVLVVAALVGAFFLGRDLWRRGRAVVRAAAAASDAAARLTEHADERAAAARRAHPVPPVALLRDRDELAAEFRDAQDARDRRADARRARNQETMQRWRRVWW